jgi:hypothetical protein
LSENYTFCSDPLAPSETGIARLVNKSVRSPKYSGKLLGRTLLLEFLALVRWEFSTATIRTEDERFTLPLQKSIAMLHWNEIISGLALAFAGFAYPLVFFVLLPFRQYDYAAPLGAIAMAIALTIAMNWLLSASLLSGWSWVAALFGFQVALMFFGSVFLEDGSYLPNLLCFGNIAILNDL